MQCPICKQNLVMSERQGVEIDYCPQCRGVWLDRGELDKLIEKSASFEGARPAQAPVMNQPHYQQPSHEQKHYDQNSSHGYGNDQHKKKKESWLGDVFDF